MKIYSSLYGSRVEVDPDYPGGKAINLTTPGTGTPGDEQWVNDFWGAHYAILAEANLTPDDVPESTNASQVLEGVLAILDDEAEQAVAGSDFIQDAPRDGTAFAIKNGVWVPSGGGKSISLLGPASVLSPSVVQYLVNNFDAFATYGASASGGVTAEVEGDTVTADVPAGVVGSYTLTVTVDGIASTFEVETTVPDQIVPLNWRTLPLGLEGGSTTQNILALAHDGTNVVSGQGAGFASRSVDLGETWALLPQWLNSGAGPGFNILSLAASGGNFVVGLNSGFASLSTDGGATWSALPQGLNSGGLRNITAIAASGDNVVAVCAGGWAARSTDGGATWSALPQGLFSGTSVTTDFLAIAASGDNFVAGLTNGFASLSTDGGATWSALPRGLNSGGLRNLTAIAASGDNFVAAFAGGWAARSTDGGATWSALPQDLDSGGSARDAGALAASNNVFVSGWESGFASLSTDGGATWSALPRWLNSGTMSFSVTALAGAAGSFVSGFGSGYASISTG